MRKIYIIVWMNVEDFSEHTYNTAFDNYEDAHEAMLKIKADHEKEGYKGIHIICDLKFHESH